MRQVIPALIVVVFVVVVVVSVKRVWADNENSIRKRTEMRKKRERKMFVAEDGEGNVHGHVN